MLRGILTAAAIALLGATAALAQSSKTPTTETPVVDEEAQPSTNAEPGASTKQAEPTEEEAAKPEAEPAEPDPQAELRAKLDEQLLGAWAEIPGGVDGNLTQELMKKAIGSCFNAISVPSLRFETTAQRALPERQDRVGNLVYYRTEKGLQRFDVQAGTITVYPQVATVQRSVGEVFVIRGRSATLPLRFVQRGKGTFMAEASRVFLRCRGLPIDR